MFEPFFWIVKKVLLLKVHDIFIAYLSLKDPINFQKRVEAA